MKNRWNTLFIYSVAVFYCTFFIQAEPVIPAEDLLVVVLMVKNEEAVMKTTLQPLVEGGIKSFFIFDTGSTDNTIEAVHTFFSLHPSCSYVIAQEPFINFAESRNRALDLAEIAFPKAHFMLMPDAEWHLLNTNELLAFCQKEAHQKENVYLVRIVSGIDFYTSRLIRCHSKARFAGVVHECIPASAKVPPSIYFELHTTAYGAQKSRIRWQRDKQLLYEEFKKNPYDSRSVFYLAQTCECLGQLEEALEWYEVRATMHGWDEEDFITRYRIAQLYEKLSASLSDPIKRAKAIAFYLDAYNARPSRAEPLVRLAQLYRTEEKFLLSYFFAKKAVALSYPTQDSLFIEKDLYDYERYDVLGIVAWYCNEYIVGEWAVLKALQAHPDYQHLHRNLLLYVEKRDTIKECFS